MTLDHNHIVTQLDTTKPLAVIGEDMQAIAEEILSFMEISSMPVDLVGPPGSGKSHMGMHLAIEWARRHSVSAYGTIHDSDTTKGTAIAGFRMEAGSTVVVPGTVASAMLDGAACFVDEFTHLAREGVQGGYNTISDRNHRTTAGGVTFEGKSTFRLVLAHNPAQYAGNLPLMPSFAGRLAVWEFAYPSISTEAQIARDIAKSELERHRPANTELSVPNAIVRYLTSLMRYYRVKAPLLGLSARNVATALLLLEIAPRKDGITNDQIDRYFVQSSGDAIRRMFAERVLFKESTDVTTADMKHTSVMLAMRYITSVGVEAFRRKILQAFMYHLDVKGSTVRNDKALREQLSKEAV